MAIESICSAGANGIVSQAILPITVAAAFLTSALIAAGYMFGEVSANAKLTVWAKTEAVQLIISIAAAVLILASINLFCSISIVSLYDTLGVQYSTAGKWIGSNPPTIYGAAEGYLVDGGKWVHDVFHVARYHMGAYNILQMYGRRECADGLPALIRWSACLFGAALGGGIGVGISIAPDSGRALLSSALGAAFNSTLFSFISIINYLFILKYVFSGFVLFFLPLGIFMRSMPYVRTLGSLLMSVALSFLVVYPFILSVFYLDILATNSVLAPRNSAEARAVFAYVGEDIGSKVTVFNALDPTDVSLFDDVFDNGGDQSFNVLRFTGNAFIIGVFIPTLALLGAVAAAGYVNRFLGEEIDLSRITQLV